MALLHRASAPTAITNNRLPARLRTAGVAIVARHVATNLDLVFDTGDRLLEANAQLDTEAGATAGPGALPAPTATEAATETE